ncbi:MAG: hypothetical protein ABIF85_02660 [Nanoarchaeota archaeon]
MMNENIQIPFTIMNGMEKMMLAIQEWYERELPDVLARMVDADKYLNNDFIIDIIGSKRAI